MASLPPGFSGVRLPFRGSSSDIRGSVNCNIAAQSSARLMNIRYIPLVDRRQSVLVTFFNIYTKSVTYWRGRNDGVSEVQSDINKCFENFLSAASDNEWALVELIYVITLKNIRYLYRVRHKF